MNKELLTTAEKMCLLQKKQKASMSNSEPLEYNKNIAQEQSSRQKKRIASMSNSERMEYTE